MRRNSNFGHNNLISNNNSFNNTPIKSNMYGNYPHTLFNSRRNPFQNQSPYKDIKHEHDMNQAPHY